MMPQMSILVAAYNAEQTLPRCLDSLCQQTLQEVEILCVNDCSTDDTLELLRNRAVMDSRIRVLQTPVNSGQAVARNLALKEATEAYLAIYAPTPCRVPSMFLRLIRRLTAACFI